MGYRNDSGGLWVRNSIQQTEGSMVNASELSSDLRKLFTGASKAFSSAFDGGRADGRKVADRDALIRAILAVLATSSQTAESVVKTINAVNTDGLKLSESEVYPLLLELVESHDATSEFVDEVRVFTLTESGKARAQQGSDEEPAGSASATDRASDFGIVGGIKIKSEFTRAALGLAQAVQAVATSGSKDLQGTATEILTEATRALHGLLAKKN